MNKETMKEGMDFRRLGLFFRKKIWLVLLLAVLGGGLGALAYQVIRGINMPVEYQATSKLYIRFNEDENGDVYQGYNGYTWNDLIHSTTVMNCIQGHTVGYSQKEISDAIEASILSDVRLLTVTIIGENEKSVREIQNAVENGLAAYAQITDELKSITAIRTIPPERIYWVDRTTIACVCGAIAFGLISFAAFMFMFIADDSIYVQSDIEKRYTYPALGIMPVAQKGLQPYLQELKANILHSLGENRKLVLIDIGDHAQLRAQDFEKILNWEEGGSLSGLNNQSGDLVWHVHEVDEDADLFNRDSDGEWSIVPVNEVGVTENICEGMRNSGGVIILVPFGTKSAPRKLERIVTLMKNQDIKIYGMVITEADEEYLNRYFS